MAYELPAAYPGAPEGALVYVGADGALYAVERPTDWADKQDVYVLGFSSTGALAWRELTTETLTPVGEFSTDFSTDFS